MDYRCCGDLAVFVQRPGLNISLTNDLPAGSFLPFFVVPDRLHAVDLSEPIGYAGKQRS
jgi:hypothetical protein